MLFNSYTFIVFFAVVLLLHQLPLSWRVRKFNLLAASYLFYAAWNPPFVILLWISTVVDWHLGRKIHATENQNLRKGLLVCSLCVNLGLLAFFKYATFALENFVAILHLMGIEFAPAAPSIILPVGISFYTFQTLSYTLDIYRRKTEPWHSFLDYAMYVTFFPQLVAGPIVRAVEFLPQCINPKKTQRPELIWGLTMMVIGLFEKMAIADGVLAPVTEVIYDQPDQAGFVMAWIGTLAFSCQIFCDFAGYSTCAIGVALCLGFHLPTNFRFPYASVGFSDFWRRWHISLSAWLRDYLYISLGGNRKGQTRTLANLMITMLLGGLWHGAAWTFVIWGGLHGLYLVLERLAVNTMGALRIWKTRWGQLLLALLTYMLVCFAWVFFRAGSFEKAMEVTRAMLGWSGAGEAYLPSWQVAAVLLITVVTLILHWSMRATSLEAAYERLPKLVKSLLIAAMIVAIVVLTGEDRAFIYFQF